MILLAKSALGNASAARRHATRRLSSQGGNIAVGDDDAPQPITNRGSTDNARARIPAAMRGHETRVAHRRRRADRADLAPPNHRSSRR